MNVLKDIYVELKEFLEKQDKYDIEQLTAIKEQNPEYTSYINVFIDCFM